VLEALLLSFLAGHHGCSIQVSQAIRANAYSLRLALRRPLAVEPQLHIDMMEQGLVLVRGLTDEGFVDGPLGILFLRSGMRGELVFGMPLLRNKA